MVVATVDERPALPAHCAGTMTKRVGVLYQLGSRKAHQIETTRRSACFPWHMLERRDGIEAERLSTLKWSTFHSRPRDSQIGACLEAVDGFSPRHPKAIRAEAEVPAG